MDDGARPLRDPRREVFVQQWLAGKSLGQAYQAAGYRGDRRDAWHVRRRPDVARRIDFIMDTRAKLYERSMVRAMKKSEVTMEKILTDYQSALDMARGQEKPDVIVKAADAQAKLVGLLRDRIEQGDVGDFHDVEDISEIIETIRKEKGDDAALFLMKAFGLNNPDHADIPDNTAEQTAA